MPGDFVHLHLHTHYSTLDGAVQAGPLMKKAAGLGVPAVAMTDHGNMFGAIEFYRAAKKQGVKPIIGCEVYLAPGARTDKSASSARDASFHFTLLAESNEGYANLSRLVTAGFLEGYHYKPRVDRELLAAHSKGIIALSGCIKGPANQALLKGDEAGAKRELAEMRDLFGAESFFVELHDHGFENQQKHNPTLAQFARDLGLGTVAANDVHFLERGHHEAHDVLVCIGTGAAVMDQRRLHYSPELYFKTPPEMRALFRDYPGACDNTLRIAERCSLEIEFGKPKYPAFDPPAGRTREEHLRDLCWEGLRHRFGAQRADTDAELRKRLEYELSVLEKCGFASYFLITWDFIRHAREQGIPVGPGRGSAAGSLVAYVLGITDIDPLKFNLLFERFLNPERVSPPDIDVDFCQERRGEVIEYVRQKYGASRVAQIITFGTLSSKAVLKDVNRVLGFSYSEGDRLSKLIPSKGAIPYDLADSLKINPELKKAIESEANTRQVWDHALVLEGLVRGTGVHAAGVVIGSEDLVNFVPLARDKDGQVLSQYDGNALNDLGLLKMDFLGLKTLTVVHDAIKSIHARGRPEFNIDAIPLADPPTLAMLNRGETVGVFQLESGGMVGLCKSFAIEGIEDIIALIALYRPGPMDLIPDYIARKRGKTRIRYAHPLLKTVCADTFGIMIYQEQVMAAASVLAGYSLGAADLLRRAMGKKDLEKMKLERVKFVEGCERVNQIGKDKADEIFDLLEKFAGYGFNRSHSAAYGWVSYQTAFLKANFSVEFMAASLTHATSASDATAKIAIFVAECQRMGLPILPPDVNRSGLYFEPEDLATEARRGADLAAEAQSGEEDGVPSDPSVPLVPSAGVRFGLAGVKNVGSAAVETILAERRENGPFRSFEDFCHRLDPKAMNRKLIESLVKCGAFDAFGEPREAMFARVEQTMAAGQRAQREKASGQFSLFGESAVGPAAAPAPSAQAPWQPWPHVERLGYEKELLGFYVTGHPLEAWRTLVLDDKRYTPLLRLDDLDDKATFRTVGWFTEVIRKFTKKENKPFAIVQLEDPTTTVEAMVWNDVYEKSNSLLEPRKVVSVRGRVDKRGEEMRVVLDEIKLAPPGRSPAASGTSAETNGVVPADEAPAPSSRLPFFSRPLGSDDDSSDGAEDSAETAVPALVLSLRPDGCDHQTLTGLRATLAEFPGETTVLLRMHRGDGSRLMLRSAALRVNRTPELEARLSAWL